MFKKEFRHILRDSRSLIMALFLPLFQMLLFGYALKLDVDRIPTLIFDGDHSADSRALIERFRGSRFFEIEGFTNSYTDIEKDIDKSSVLLGIVIPRDYSQRLNAGGKANIQILLDGSDSNTASIALSYVEGLIQNYALQVRSNGQDRRAGIPLVSPVDARVRIWYNSTLESTNYIVPGLIAAMMMVIAALLTSLTIAREWEMGTMEQLLSTPVRAAEIVMGKMLAFFVVGLADTTIAVQSARREVVESGCCGVGVIPDAVSFVERVAPFRLGDIDAAEVLPGRRARNNYEQGRHRADPHGNCAADSHDAQYIKAHLS